MNPTLSLTLSFLLFTFLSNLSPNNAGQPVFDTNGKPVVFGKQYFISPATDNIPTKGGLTLNKVGDDSKCPVTVLQNNAITGLPVKFTIPQNTTGIGPEIGMVTSSDLEIEFIEKPDCAESSKWLVFVDDKIQENCVGIGGPANYPGVEIISGKFLVVTHTQGPSYRIGFCLDSSGDCFYVGLQEFNSGEGGSRLILTIAGAYNVVFVDADSVKSQSI
ncbi:kunitz-type trypsin inhibitor-like 2 protein [Trifolium pratense]|nr:kunitz-type trypsin inhibitor-like 2 protein [Trifolium pratense]